MVIDTGADIKKEAIFANLKKITNQIFKLLPNREENIDWETPLATIVEELSGMDKVLSAYHETLFALLCKLNGLYELKGDNDFFSYRRTIFECLNLLSTLKGEIEACQE
jgi:hypothetical protein